MNQILKQVSYLENLAFIRDLITYEAETLKALEQAFQESVDGYLESCAELG